jgi:hypothetical protein
MVEKEQRQSEDQIQRRGEAKRLWRRIDRAEPQTQADGPGPRGAAAQALFHSNRRLLLRLDSALHPVSSNAEQG